MNQHYKIPLLPLPYDFETKEVLKRVNAANRKLAELKGIALTIPNENILVSTLVLQEALDSSAVENIVTTSDELYKTDLNEQIVGVGLLQKVKLGRTNYYINTKLMDLFIHHHPDYTDTSNSIESAHL